MSADKVEYKDTITLEYITKRYNPVSGEIEEVTPDSFSAFLETAETTPVQIAELEDIVTVNDHTYWVRFYANSDTDVSIESGTAYYIAFYWEYSGVKKCERHLVVVVPNV